MARRNLPKQSATATPGARAPKGHVAYQLPFLPITFRVDDDGTARLEVGRSLVTPFGEVSVYSGVAYKAGTEEPLEAQPADVTQLIICANQLVTPPDPQEPTPQGSESSELATPPGPQESTPQGSESGEGQRCEAYQIGTGRKMRIEMNGRFLQEVERNRIVINAEPGSTIVVSDAGGPPKDVRAREAARPAIVRTQFEELGSETEVDLERSQAGTAADIAYDHLTGGLSLINGARIAQVKKPRFFHELTEDDIPSEYECQQAEDWKDSFGPDDLKKPIIACIKTAEADLGYLVVWPHSDTRPPKLEFYSFVWVR